MGKPVSSDEKLLSEGFPRSKAGEAFRIIRADILAARLKPGEKLAFGRLQTSYQFGIAPLREALVRLSADGLVRGEEQRGFRVTPISKADLYDITQVSIHIESEAIAKAINGATPQSDLAMVAAFHRLAALSPGSSDDPGSLGDQWSQYHSDFHELLVGSCGSPWLLNLRRILFDQGDRYRRISFSFSATSRDLTREHRALMSAVLDRDVDRARKLVEEHWSRTAEIVASDLPANLWTS